MSRTLTPADVLIALVVVAIVVVLFAQGHGNRAHSILADPVRTPGVLNPDVTQANIRSTICRHGWTRTVRPPVSYTNGLKAKGLRQYRLRGPPSAFQEDHLISLELGGDPIDPRNLWPEPYPRASAVDQIENDLNHRVCAGSLSLADAQRRESALKHRDG